MESRRKAQLRSALSYCVGKEITEFWAVRSEIESHIGVLTEEELDYLRKIHQLILQ